LPTLRYLTFDLWTRRSKEKIKEETKEKRWQTFYKFVAKKCSMKGETVNITETETKSETEP